MVGCRPTFMSSHGSVFCFSSLIPPQAYKAVVNDATIFKLELPLKQKGWVETGRGGRIQPFQDYLSAAVGMRFNLVWCVCVCVSIQTAWAWRLSRSQSALSSLQTTVTCCWGKPLWARSSARRKLSSNSKKWWESVLWAASLRVARLFLCAHPLFCFHRLSLQLLVLKYVQNKDVFMRYHKAHLTRRLILDISADSEIEENMVEWLRVS